MADDQLLAAVNKLLEEAALHGLEEQPGEASPDHYRRQVAEQLLELSRSTPEVDSGGVKVIIGGRSGARSVPIGRTVWPLLVCGVALVLPAFDPTGLTWGVAGAAVLNAVEKVREAIKNLDPAERVVCRAIGEVMREKKEKGQEPEVSEDEIKTYFKQQQEQVPRDLKAILDKLIKENVLSEKRYPQDGPYYRLPF